MKINIEAIYQTFADANQARAVINKYHHRPDILKEIEKRSGTISTNQADFILKYGWRAFTKIYPYFRKDNYNYICDNYKQFLTFIIKNNYKPPQYTTSFVFVKFILWKHNIKISRRAIKIYSESISFVYSPHLFETLIDFCKNNLHWLEYFPHTLFAIIRSFDITDLLKLTEEQKLNLLRNVAFIYGGAFLKLDKKGNTLPLEYWVLPLPEFLNALTLLSLVNEKVIEILPHYFIDLFKLGATGIKPFILMKSFKVWNIMSLPMIYKKVLNCIIDCSQKYGDLSLKSLRLKVDEMIKEV